MPCSAEEQAPETLQAPRQQAASELRGRSAYQLPGDSDYLRTFGSVCKRRQWANTALPQPPELKQHPSSQNPLSTLQHTRLGAPGKCGHKTSATKAKHRGFRPCNPQAAWPHMRLLAAGTRKRGASAIAARSATIWNNANWNCFPACAECALLSLPVYMPVQQCMIWPATTSALVRKQQQSKIIDTHSHQNTEAHRMAARPASPCVARDKQLRHCR